jgi:hypothetical protein
MKTNLRDRVKEIAARVRLIGLAARGFEVADSIGEGDMQGVIDLAERLERELVEIANEIDEGAENQSDADKIADLAMRPEGVTRSELADLTGRADGLNTGLEGIAKARGLELEIEASRHDTDSSPLKRPKGTPYDEADVLIE